MAKQTQYLLCYLHQRQALNDDLINLRLEGEREMRRIAVELQLFWRMKDSSSAVCRIYGVTYHPPSSLSLANILKLLKFWIILQITKKIQWNFYTASKSPPPPPMRGDMQHPGHAVIWKGEEDCTNCCKTRTVVNFSIGLVSQRSAPKPHLHPKHSWIYSQFDCYRNHHHRTFVIKAAK